MSNTRAIETKSRPTPLQEETRSRLNQDQKQSNRYKGTVKQYKQSKSSLRPSPDSVRSVAGKGGRFLIKYKMIEAFIQSQKQTNMPFLSERRRSQNEFEPTQDHYKIFLRPRPVVSIITTLACYSLCPAQINVNYKN